MLVKRPTTGQVTRRDLEMVEWLARLLGASIDLIRRRFSMGQSQAYLRLKVLRESGLVDRRAVLAGRPALFSVRARELGPSTYEHAVAVASLVADLELRGARVATDVELRGVRNSQSLLMPLDPTALETFIGCRRTPDVVERLDQGGLGAYELELSSKGRARREAILTQYALSDYEFVRWIVPDPALRALLRTEVSEMGLTELMAVSG